MLMLNPGKVQKEGIEIAYRAEQELFNVHVNSFENFSEMFTWVLKVHKLGKCKQIEKFFMQREDYVDTMGCNKKMIAEHIRDQLMENYTADLVSSKEYANLFTSSKNKGTQKRQLLEAAALKCEICTSVSVGADGQIIPRTGCRSARLPAAPRNSGLPLRRQAPPCSRRGPACGRQSAPPAPPAPPR